MIKGLTTRILSSQVIGIILIVFALQTLSYGVSVSVRGTDTGSFFGFCLVAGAVSFGLGRYEWNVFWAIVVIVVTGTFIIWISGAQLVAPLTTLVVRSFSLIIKYTFASQTAIIVDSSSVSEIWSQIIQNTSGLFMRFEDWLASNGTTNDPLILSMIWTFVLWLCSAWAGWHTSKRNAVISLLPSLILLAMITSYTEYRTESTWGMAMTILVLMGVWHYKNRVQQWQSLQIDFSDSIQVDNGQAVVIFTLMIGSIAIITPSISWRDIFNYVQERRGQNNTAEIFGIQEPESSGQVIVFREPTLPRIHLLDEGAANSDDLVMTVSTGELPPMLNQSLLTAPIYYWRNTVYDRYTGNGWETTRTETESFSPNTPLIPGVLSHYRPVNLYVTLANKQPGLIWSGVLFSADIPLEVDWRIRPPTDLFAEQSALLRSDIFSADMDAVNYQLHVYVPNVTGNELAQTTVDYPEIIRQYYLPLPNNLPQRVSELAEEITRDISNPYEKARAIETFLRLNYPYDLNIPAPPPDRDVADYFLFDLKKGYCDYYATAMVILARANGIPARFVSGYAPGYYDAENAEYIIRELNAHSWAEIYFTDIGWIEFEPTASIPAIEHGVGFIPGKETEQAIEEGAMQTLNRFRLERILFWTAPAWMTVIGFCLYYLLFERWFYLRHDPNKAIYKIHKLFYRSGRNLAGASEPGETPAEFLHKLTSNLSGITNTAGFAILSLDVINNATILTQKYQVSLFADHHMTAKDANSSWKIWKILRRQLFTIKFIAFIQKITSFLHLDMYLKIYKKT